MSSLTIAPPPELVALVPDGAARIDVAVLRARECGVPDSETAAFGTRMMQEIARVLLTNPEEGDADAAAQLDASIQEFEADVAAACRQRRGPYLEMGIGAAVGAAAGGTLGAVLAKKSERLGYGALGGLAGSLVGAVAGAGVHSVRSRPKKAAV